MAGGRTVDLAFRADLSNLVAQLQKMPGMTEAEAKKMAASLERQIKKAEAASVKAAQATSKAWQASQASAQAASKATGGLAGSLGTIERAGGKAGSIMTGLAGALGMVSPEAAAIANGLNDAAGGVEAVARAGPGMIGILGPIAVAAGATTIAYAHFSKQLEEAEARMKAAAAQAAEMQQVFGALDTTKQRVDLELAVARGEAEASALAAFDARKKAEQAYVGPKAKAKELEIQQQNRLNEATKQLAEAEHGLANTIGAEGSYSWNKYKDRADKAQKAVDQFTKTRDAARRVHAEIVAGESELEIKLIKLAKTKTDTTKKTTTSVQATRSEIEKLKDATEKMLPQAEVDKVDQLRAHLEQLQAAANGSSKAAKALAPAMAATAQAIADLEAKRAADDLAALVAEADKLAPPATLSRLDQLIAMEEKLKAAIVATGDASGELAAAQATVHAEIMETIDEEVAATRKAAQEKAEAEKQAATQIRDAYMDAYSNINSAASMVAAEVLSRAEEAASEEIDFRTEAAENAQSLLDAEIAHRNELLERAKDEDVRRELAASNAAIASLRKQSEAEAAALEESRNIQNQAVRRAFIAQQALRLSEIAMSTAAAMMNAAATTPPPAQPFVLGAIAALGATQAALVGAQEPPTFHLGGMVGGPDEQVITARRGEAVLTRQGVSAIGGEAGVQAANRGHAGGPLVVQMVYRHKVLDEVLTDSISRGGPIQSAIDRRSPRGRRNPHGTR